MLGKRSIAAFPPSLDRESIRAALVRQAPWPITADELATQVCAAIGRPDGRWVSKPEEALLQAFLTRSGGGGPAGPKFAAPALGRPGYRKLLERFRQVHWMEPAPPGVRPSPSLRRCAGHVGTAPQRQRGTGVWEQRHHSK